MLRLVECGERGDLQFPQDQLQVVADVLHLAGEIPLGIALFVVGVGLGLAFTVASDVILASVPPQRAGSAAAVSETAYELGMALGIAFQLVDDVLVGGVMFSPDELADPLV